MRIFDRGIGGGMNAERVKELLKIAEPELDTDLLSVFVHLDQHRDAFIVRIEKRITDFSMAIACKSTFAYMQQEISLRELRMSYDPEQYLRYTFERMAYELDWAKRPPSFMQDEPEPEPEPEPEGVKVIRVRECGGCRAPVPKGQVTCEFCGGHFEEPGKPKGIESGAALRAYAGANGGAATEALRSKLRRKGFSEKFIDAQIKEDE